MIHENRLTKETYPTSRQSFPLSGKEKDVVEGVIKILDKRYSERWESYNYTAMDGKSVSS